MVNLNTAYICNIKKLSLHCKENCLHGVPHIKDGCTKPEKCSAYAKQGKLVKSQVVQCKKLTIKQIKEINDNARQKRGTLK
jgi:hypothetical protein